MPTATGTIRTTSTGTTGFVLLFLTSLFVAQIGNLRYARNTNWLRLVRRGFIDGWMMSWLTLP